MMLNKLTRIWRTRVFGTQKQDRQFFSLFCSAIALGVSWGEYLNYLDPSIKLFCGIIIGTSLVIMAVTLLELYSEGKLIAGESK